MWTAQPIRGRDKNGSDQWEGSFQRILTFSEIDSKTMWILKFVWKNSKIETTQKYLEVLSNLLEDMTYSFCCCTHQQSTTHHQLTYLYKKRTLLFSRWILYIDNIWICKLVVNSKSGLGAHQYNNIANHQPPDKNSHNLIIQYFPRRAGIQISDFCVDI